MKNHLNYQSTEFDCGPVSLLNAIRYLFDREEIPPDLVKFINLYCLDAYNDKGELGKSGTSWAAMRFMAKWINDFSRTKAFPIQCKFLGLEDVVIKPGTRIHDFIKNGGAAVLHLFLEVPHYVLVTGVDNENIYLFDPYYEEYDAPDFDQEYLVDDIEFIFDQPKKANRRVSLERLNRFTEGYYEMGQFECREALLLERTSDEPVTQK